MADQPFKYVEVNRRILNQNGLNSFDSYTNSARKQMFSGSHIAQALVIRNPSQKIFLTGMEERYGETVYDIRMPERGTILRVLPRYRASDDAEAIIQHPEHNPETVVLYKAYDTNEIGMFTLPGHFSGHTYFGYRYKPTANLSRIRIGEAIDEGVVFLTSPNVMENGDYRYGKILKTAIMSHPSVAEDGFMICEDVLSDMTTSLFKKRDGEWGENELPLNLYGDDEHYQPFPNLGQLVREDDILIAFRRNDKYSAWADQSRKRLRVVNPFRDRCIYSGGGGERRGRVVDIRVYHDEYNPSTLPVEMDEQVMRYYREDKRFYQELDDEITSTQRRYGKGNVELSPELHFLHVRALAVLDTLARTAQEKRRLIYQDNPMDVWRVVFTIEHQVAPNKGFKLSNASATKGVITHIAKPEEMPVDADGNRADVVLSPYAIPNRVVPSMTLEMYFGSAVMKATQTIREILGITYGDPHYARKIRQVYVEDQDRFERAWAHWLEFSEIVSPVHQYQLLISEDWFRRLGGDAVQYLIDGLKDEYLSIFSPPENPRNFTWATKKIEANAHLRPCHGPVTYVDYTGERVTTIERVRIAPIHYILLEKITDDGSAVASSKTQIHGFLAQVTTRDKYSNPLKMNPTRVVSETDLRNIAAFAGEEAAAELIDRNNSVLTRREIQKRIISADHPTQIEAIIDRTTFPYGGSKPLQILKNIGLCAGIKYTYTPYQDDAQPNLPDLIP